MIETSGNTVKRESVKQLSATPLNSISQAEHSSAHASTHGTREQVVNTTMSAAAAMEALRGALLCLSLMTCWGTTTHSPATNPYVSYLPTGAGNSSVPYKANQNPTEHHQDHASNEGALKMTANVDNGLARLERNESSGLQPGQVKTLDDLASLDNASDIDDDSDLFDFSDRPTAQEFTDVTLNPLKRVTGNISDCDMFMKFFHYNGTLFLYASWVETEIQDFPSSCWFTITVPASLSLKTRVDCVSGTDDKCCFSSNDDYYVRHDGYGRAPEKTTVISPDSFRIILLHHSKIRPLHVNMSLTTFPSPSPCRWNVHYISATHGTRVSRFKITLLSHQRNWNVAEHWPHHSAQ